MKIGFLGAGNMGEALARGILKAQLAQPGQLLLNDVAPARMEQLSRDLGCVGVATSRDLVSAADVIVFAVKPQNMPLLLKELADEPAVRERLPKKVFITICAGITTATIEAGLRGGDTGLPVPRVVRVMPNTPALLGEGAAGVAPGAASTEADLYLTLSLLRAVGTAEEVTEEQMDAVTALSGSGPAYVFYLIEAMQKAGAEQGLPADVARRLTLQTVLGAARMASEQSDTPTSELRHRVTSPNGTTAAGLAVLDRHNFVGLVGDCIAAATARGRELGKSNR